MMKNVNMQMMAARSADSEFQKMIEPYVGHHEFFVLNAMRPRVF